MNKQPTVYLNQGNFQTIITIFTYQILIVQIQVINKLLNYKYTIKTIYKEIYLCK